MRPIRTASGSFLYWLMRSLRNDSRKSAVAMALGYPVLGRAVVEHLNLARSWKGLRIPNNNRKKEEDQKLERRNKKGYGHPEPSGRSR